MSSEISTDARTPSRAAFEPWQLFVLAGLIGAAIVAFRAGAQASSARIFLIVTIFAAAAIGLAALRTLAPLTGVVSRESRLTLGERTRAVLEREKMLALRAIKELEFDRAMGKVSDRDYQEMAARLRARAARILRQLDESPEVGYRTTIEQEIARRIGTPNPSAAADLSAGALGKVEAAAYESAEAPGDSQKVACSSCRLANDTDARFCKGCGARLEAACERRCCSSSVSWDSPASHGRRTCRHRR
jgi:hypothetical protein